MLDRRHFFRFASSGLASAAVLGLWQREQQATAEATQAAALPPGKATRAIHICLVGGLSQVDSFDPKPALARLHGTPLSADAQPQTFFGQAGLLRQSDWAFRPRGESGLEISDLFPHLAEVADELTLIRSMVADSANHMPAMFQENSGFQVNGYPTLGSWLSYGLGRGSDSLPTFVVLPDARSLPNGGASNWSSGFLPAEHQGQLFRGGRHPIRNLFAEPALPAETQDDALRLLASLNRQHLEAHRSGASPPPGLLEARIRSYELAAEMQVSVPEAISFAEESPAMHELYGLNDPGTADAGRRCLLARRLLQRGVRFVQLYSGGAFGGKPRHGWDGHEDNRLNHAREAALIDKPVAALITDLRQQGMLDDTLVLCTSEFGRTPFTQSAAGTLGLGRDHNAAGFTVWMAGGGLRKGIAYGETDDLGWRAVSNPVTWPDFHATVLHLLGLNHEALTWYHNGIDRRLTNVHGAVIRDLLA